MKAERKSQNAFPALKIHRCDHSEMEVHELGVEGRCSCGEILSAPEVVLSLMRIYAAAVEQNHELRDRLRLLESKDDPIIDMIAQALENRRDK